ncbi:prostaglandin reductase-3-like isoform X3 [Lytechinus pictus]|uniref:prostaglandin reductase-3-like isoform X3 n=1 Tax=Lytechinus pictus TaxID=7653 RepID=UPI0030B9B3FA
MVNVALIMALPNTFRKMMITKLSTNFREAVKIMTVPMIEPAENEVVMRTRYVGINASEINASAGRYANTGKPPFGAGMESVGEIVSVGSGVKNLQVGQAIASMTWGAFSEYTAVPAKMAIPLPAAKPDFVTLMVSGMTADLSLAELGDLKKGENVLITAAAGGTGQFAVQLAKLAGCHVIGTCSTDSKVEFLKKIGCDRPVNYKKENLKDVLRSEYPEGIDVVYETIGGEMFSTCLKALANKGRIIVIGFIESYQKEGALAPKNEASWSGIVLQKSASIRGFLLFHFADLWKRSLTNLTQLLMGGQLKVSYDQGKHDPKGPFTGLEAVYDAVDYLYTKKSEGKIVVEINPEEKPKL